MAILYYHHHHLKRVGGEEKNYPVICWCGILYCKWANQRRYNMTCLSK